MLLQHTPQRTAQSKTTEHTKSTQAVAVAVAQQDKQYYDSAKHGFIYHYKYPPYIHIVFNHNIQS